MFALGGMFALAGCFDSDDCENEIVSITRAPDAARDAAIFQRDCGATTGFSTQVSVVSAGVKVLGPGSTFIADTDHGTAQSADWGGPWAEVEWKSPAKLMIRYDRRAQIFTAETSIDGIEVIYEPLDR